MNEQKAKEAVRTGARVVARYGTGGAAFEGRVWGYSGAPVLYIETDDGRRLDWRADMCEPVEKATS